MTLPSAPHAGSPLRASPGTPLYVHLPFCAAKCPYCDFYSLVGEGHDKSALVDDLLREAEARAPASPRTVFLGGGTPSYLDTRSLTRLLDGLDRITGFRRSAREVTAECNPESLDEDKARTFLDHGVDRLSIGFQSLDPATLELFGRVHDVEQSFAAFRAARRAGLPRLSADLIYGAPGQTPEACRREVERVLDLGPDHLSAYNLTFEEGTPFETWRRQGRVARADEVVELELFWTVRDAARPYGFQAYEISNFSPEGQQCAHNVNYWHNGAYVGLGPSAVSKIGPRRCGNARSLAHWQAAVRAGQDPSLGQTLGQSPGAALAFDPTGAPDTPGAWWEELDDDARLGETWWLGLRLSEGLSPREARERSGWSPARPGLADPAAARAVELCGQGFLEPVPGSDRVRLSERGLPLADAVAREFLELPPILPATQGAPA